MAENTHKSLQNRFKEVDWNYELNRILGLITAVAKRVGRVAARELLIIYYVLKVGDLTHSDKLKVYAALLYVLVPNDLISSKVFGLLGLTDDLGALYYAYKKISSKITPEIELMADMKLDEWFGYEIGRL